MYKLFLQTLLVLFAPLQIFAQVITTSPAFPIENQPVIITFHANQGNLGLEGYDGDVYVHTGVITVNSTSGSDWKYVVSNWGENIEKCKLTRIATDTYSLNIGPSIREYYEVPVEDTILKIAMVFRSDFPVNDESYFEGKTADGGDIFTDVYELGLNVDIESPISGEIVGLNETTQIIVNASEAELVKFYINNEFIGDYPAEGFTYDFQATEAGKTNFKVEAYDASEMVSDSSYVFVRGAVIVEDRPAGMHDGVNYLSDNSVLLSLLAPDKDYVFALGSFSNWEVNNDVFMKQTPDGERFWVQIDNLNPGEPYIYQYYIDGDLKVADVYSEQISDPWNDSYIEESVFPNLPEYPFGLTSGIASVFTTGQIPYEWQVADFQAPKVTDMVIYEILIRDITTEHTFQSLIDTISYFKNLGINVIELMPINEFEGNNSWGYNPSFYFAVDKYYGPKNKLKEFIDLCHHNGMAVVIDMVLNHSYGQNPQVQMYWDGVNNRPAANNPWFNTVSPNQSYHWGYDFNHESQYTEAFVDSVNAFWMTEFNVDGFRFDFTKGFTNTSGDGWPYDASRISILQGMSNAIWQVNEDAYVILEHLSDNTEEKVLANSGMLLWGNMNFKYKEANMGYNSGDKSDLSWASYKKRSWTSPHVVAYMESHDEERQMVYNNSWGNSNGWYDITNEDISLRRIEMSTLFHIMIPGPKMYWQFGELGFDLSINWPSGESYDRLTAKPPKWEYQEEWRRKYLHDLTAALNILKANNDAWETDDFQISVVGAIKTVTLLHESMNVVAVGNFDVVRKNIELTFPSGGEWFNYFDGQSITVGNDGIWSTTIAQGAYYLFTDVQLANPNIGTGIADVVICNDANLLIYPNPANETITVELKDAAKGAIEILVKDLNGKEVMFKKAYAFTNQWQDSLSIKDLKAGVYFVQVQTENAVRSLKFVKI